MKDADLCPGRCKCHGPANWCNQCGDMDLVCDDPDCEVHLRGRERDEIHRKAQRRFLDAEAEYHAAKKEYFEAEESCRRYRTGNVVMVARQTKEKR